MIEELSETIISFQRGKLNNKLHAKPKQKQIKPKKKTKNKIKITLNASPNDHLYSIHCVFMCFANDFSPCFVCAF